MLAEAWKDVSEDYRFEISMTMRVGPWAKSLRSRIAWWLRNRADAIDGFESISMLYLSTGNIERERIHKALRHGFTHAGNLLREECRIEAIDGAMHEAGWYEDGKGEKQ